MPAARPAPSRRDGILPGADRIRRMAKGTRDVNLTPARLRRALEGAILSLTGVPLRISQLRQHAPVPIRLPAHYATTPLPARPPVISVVTPSHEQGRFLDQTIASVVDQRYPMLEYIVVDNCSTDETPGILARRRDVLAHCCVEPDRGQANAINKGFARSTGEVMAWLNSDDLLLPGALAYVAGVFAQRPDVDVVYGHRLLIDEAGGEIGRWVLPPHSNSLLSWADYVPQETMFWRRRAWERAGGALDESFQFALDWDLLLRFRDAGARIVRLPRFLGAFRVHAQQKSLAWYESHGVGEMARVRQRQLGRVPTQREIQWRVLPYMLQRVAWHGLHRAGLLRH